MSLDAPTSGKPCQAIDLAPLYWLIPAIVLVVVAAGIVTARSHGCVEGVSRV